MAGEEAGKEVVSSKRKKAEGNEAGGMGWGARSSAATRINSIREKDPASSTDFGRYMAEKRRKLHVQYNQDSSNKLLSGATAAVAAQHSNPGQMVVAENVTKSQLFKDISIWVDGFTIPSHQELRHLMLQFGGNFENYFRRELVTHIICSTLPDSKIKDPRSLSRGLPIVRPEWIVDSIAASRVLPWAQYQLQRLALEHPNQRTLKESYAALKLDDGPLPLDWRDGNLDITEATQEEVKRDQELMAPENGLFLPSVGGNVSGGQDASLIEGAGCVKLNNDHVVDDMTTRDAVCPSNEELNGHEEENTGEHLKASMKEDPEKDSTEARVDVIGGVNKKRQSDADAARIHSTLGDKNFVQNYYKFSRLHFIGTWRNRYQSRYGSLAKDEKTDVQEHQCLSSAPPAIIHIDMDCFFVAVVTRDRRELDGKPVAVCHSDSARGTGEISSANYAARAFGVRAAMYVREAKLRCPALEIVPYNFEAYEKVADQVYEILHRHCGRVQAVSCDEAFLDVTGQGDPIDIATSIRREIFDATQCTASAGIAGNMLLSRLATRKAKPNGQYCITPEQVDEFLATLAVEDLPGVGWTLKEKLHLHNLRKCCDLQKLSKDFLKKEFGMKTGDMLWSYARGIDVREVHAAQERKSIGAEVNWGVRFLVQEDAQRFLVTLSTEVAKRLQEAASKGRTITLKVKRRKEGEGEPSKFMGCGVCDNFSRSETVAYATDSQVVLFRVAKQLFNSFQFDVREVRGVGLQVTRLEPVTSGQPLKGGQGHQGALESWLGPQRTKEILPEDALQGCKSGFSDTSGDGHKSVRTEHPQPAVDKAMEAPIPRPSSWPQDEFTSHLERIPSKAQLGLPKITSSVSKNVTVSTDHTGSGRKPPIQTITKAEDPRKVLPTSLPAMSDLDPSVLASLPSEILAEIRAVYEELPGHPVIAPRKATVGTRSAPVSPANKVSNRQLSKQGVKLETLFEKQISSNVKRALPLPLESRSEHGEPSRLPSDNSEIIALPPASQLDPSVMAALPLSLRRELEQEYKRQQSESIARPPVRKFVKTEPSKIPNIAKGASTSKSEQLVKQPQDVKNADRQTLLTNLWCGSPPKWVPLFKEFKLAEFNTLCLLAEKMLSGLPSKPFSTVLLSLLPHLSQNSPMTVDETITETCVELLKQYIQLKVASDLEEVSMVSRVLRRVAAKSHLWKIVEHFTAPFIQGAVGDYYGGHLKF